MARPSQAKQRREELLPVLTVEFARSGFRRATTAGLAEACGLRENQLYRLWPSKKAMFLAVLQHLFELETAGWKELLAAHASPEAAITAILDREGRQRGSSGLHRITLAALSESDDPEIHAAVSKMYKQFHRFIRDTLKRSHTLSSVAEPALDPTLAAWAFIGLGTMINIGREFDLFSMPTQRRLTLEAGACLSGLADATE